MYKHYKSLPSGLNAPCWGEGVRAWGGVKWTACKVGRLNAPCWGEGVRASCTGRMIRRGLVSMPLAGAKGCAPKFYIVVALLLATVSMPRAGAKGCAPRKAAG